MRARTRSTARRPTRRPTRRSSRTRSRSTRSLRRSPISARPRARTAAGWYNNDVTNRFEASDATSGPNSACQSAFPLSAGHYIQSKTTTGEGSNVHVSSDGCTDAAGNSTAAIDSADFKVDKTKPSSLASSPTYNNDGTIDVGYSEGDGSGDVSGVKRVDLYVKAPGDLTYSLAMSDIVGTGTGIDHTFAYAVPSSGGPPDYIQGTYRFYTIATDVADNAELAPANPDATTTQTLQDSIAPA